VGLVLILRLLVDCIGEAECTLALGAGLIRRLYLFGACSSEAEASRLRDPG